MFIIITTMAAPVEEHAKHPHSPHLFVSPKTGTMFDPDSFRHTHEKILKAIGSVISQTIAAFTTIVIFNYAVIYPVLFSLFIASSMRVSEYFSPLILITPCFTAETSFAFR